MVMGDARSMTTTGPSLPGLPPAYTAAPLCHEDAAAVTELMAACEEHDIGEVQIELEDVVGDWQRPSFDLATQSVGVRDRTGRLVAYAEVYQARRAEAYVLPGERGRGIGAALMTWTWRLAADLGGALVGQTVPEKAGSAVGLLRAHGYRTLWTSWILELPPGTDLSSTLAESRSESQTGTRADPGLARPAPVIRPMASGRDAHAAYRVVEDAFGEWPDRDPVSFEDWSAVVLERPGFEPWQLLLATEPAASGAGRTQGPEVPEHDDGDVVGVCFVVPSRDTGWVQYLAVRRDRRGRGLARALLLRAFGEAQARGMPRAELATDSRTGALDLYLHVGMRVKQSFVHLARDLTAELGS